nr:hypothetical protein [uncultured Emticicia sp.]
MNKVSLLIINLFLVTLQQTYSQTKDFSKNEESQLNIDSIMIENIAFNNGKIKLNMPINVFLKNYPNSKFLNIRINDSEAEGGYYEEPRYYLNSNTYVFVDNLVNEKVKKILEIHIEDKGFYLDNCPIIIGDSIAKLQKCFPNTYKLYVEKKMSKLKSRINNGNTKILEQFPVTILYKDMNSLPLYLLFWWNIKTLTISKIEIRYQE